MRLAAIKLAHVREFIKALLEKELVTLVGRYHLILFVTNALGIPLESYAARFPPCRDGET